MKVFEGVQYAVVGKDNHIIKRVEHGHAVFKNHVHASIYSDKGHGKWRVVQIEITELKEV